MNQPDDKPKPPVLLPDHQLNNPQAPASKTGKLSLGLVVAVVGALLLARNLGYEFFFLDIHNWWAFLILFTALGPIHQAWRFYSKGEVWAATNSLVFAAGIIFIALLFLIDLAFWTWWPVFIILIGLYLMSNRNR
ncbi:LiaF transmembrane domain-containing protein [Cellvibrio fontiphilus]|uniref:LiaF transmembrane domain-containing protein n=1 Tax=Cellvibrio fontiphilus TaxID=1815559 RepID=A0ABV7FME8_9GAMM